MEFSGSSKYELLLVYVAAALAAIWVLSMLLFPRKKLNLPPGPRGWPILGNLMSLGTHPQITLTNMAAVYGPILYLRLGQRDCIVVSSPEMAEEFLKTRDANFSGRPHMIHADILEYGSQGTKLTINSAHVFSSLVRYAAAVFYFVFLALHLLRIRLLTSPSSCCISTSVTKHQ